MRTKVDGIFLGVYRKEKNFSQNVWIGFKLSNYFRITTLIKRYTGFYFKTVHYIFKWVFIAIIHVLFEVS